MTLEITTHSPSCYSSSSSSSSRSMRSSFSITRDLCSNFEIKRRSLTDLFAEKRPSLDGTPPILERQIAQETPQIFPESKAAESLSVLEIISVDQFKKDAGLSLKVDLLDEEVVQILLRDLANYHKVRLERHSIYLQEQFLRNILKDCVIAASGLDLNKSEDKLQIRDSLCNLFTTTQTKRKYLKQLIRNLKKPSTSIGVVGSAKLEAIDPLNRGWCIRSTIWQEVYAEITSKNKHAAKNLKKFFREVEAKPWEMFIRAHPHLKRCSVRYLTEAERAAYEVTIVKKNDQEAAIFMKQGAPYDTTEGWAAIEGAGIDIFVFKEGHLFSGRHEIGLLHHSSFFAGGPTDCEGEIKCIDGKLVYINLQSGHYKPTRDDAKDLLKWLNDHKVNLEAVHIETVESIEIPIIIFELNEGYEWSKKNIEHSFHMKINYKALELHQELNEHHSPAPRSCELQTEVILTTLRKTYSRKANQLHLDYQLPIEMTFCPLKNSWNFIFGRHPIEDLTTIEELEGSSSGSPSGDIVAGYLDSE